MKNEYLKNCEVCDTPISGQKVKYCSNKCKQKAHWYRVKEQTNTYHSQTKRALKRKLELINLRGGGCEKCGYNKNITALEFHHIDPNSKDGVLTVRQLGNMNMNWIMNEFSKTKVLCANCHREEHNPDMTFDDVNKIINS
jgi:hypothetical protein